MSGVPSFERRIAKGHGLGGNTKKESTRAELLDAVRSERAARAGQRQLTRSATRVQSTFRGWRERHQARTALLARWIGAYGPAAANPDTLLPALTIMGEVVPPILLACLPALLAQDAAGASVAVPLPARRKALARQHPPGSGAAASNSPAVRGALALVLRSLGSPDATLNYASLSASPEHRVSWRHQAHRLLLLCCALVGSPAADTLTQTAASRLAVLLTDAASWKCFSAGDSSAAATAEELSHTTASLGAHARAARRLLLSFATSSSNSAPADPAKTAAAPTSAAGTQAGVPYTQAPGSGGAGSSPNSQKTNGGGPSSPQAGASSARNAAAAAAQPRVALANMLQTAFRPLCSAASNSEEQSRGPDQLHRPAEGASCSGGGSAAPAGAAAAAALHAARHLLTAPGFAREALTPTGRAIITGPAAISGLFWAARQLAGWKSELPSTGQPSLGSGGASSIQAGSHSELGREGAEALTHKHAIVARLARGMSAAEFTRALASLSALAAGAVVTRQLPDGRRVEVLEPSAVLRRNGAAEAFLAAAAELLSAAVEKAIGQSRTDDRADCAAALEELWVLRDGSFLTQLLDCLSRGGGLGSLAVFLHDLLVGLPKLAAAAGVPPDAATARFVNTLAFGGPLLSRLWPWLAREIGLPLEAPRDATRGWDIASLRLGIPGLAPGSQAAPLGLFCRAYAHLLLVLDDGDFYDSQQPFTLAQQRGMATALNTLVFRTHCPPDGASLPASAGKPEGLFPQRQLLREWASVVLRALYERDMRRAFAPPALWLAPYEADQQRDGSFLAASVVRALGQHQQQQQQQQSGGGGGGGAGTIPGMQAGIPGRPAALAALLSEAPQCVPFEQRVLVFRALIQADKERGKWELPVTSGGPAPTQIVVRRGSLLEDGYMALRNAGSALKGRLEVTFVSQQGYQEAGIDHGGLVKEFLEEVVKAGFNADYGLITSTEDGRAYPSPAASRIGNGGALLAYLGLVLGKALYEGILLDAPLASVFIQRLQGRRPLFDELSTLDSELHRSLVQVKRYEGDAADLGLDFTVEEETLGRRRVLELRPGGASIPVSDANKLQYIHLVADWHLNGRLGTGTSAFASGLWQIIPPAWLRLFSPSEVNQLLGGGEGGGVDVEDLRKHARYSGGYKPDSPTIKLFWKVLGDLPQKDRGALLKFVTSVSRVPLGGCQHMQPPLTIHKVDCGASLLAVVGGKDVDRLPSASTCYNMLKLPNYRRASTLREKLLYAIHSGAGFELS